MLGQINAGFYDAFVTNYDLTGESLRIQEFGSADGDYVRTIALAPGGFYVLGVTNGATQMFIRSSDSSGTEICTQRFNDPFLIDIQGAAADTTGVYFSGMTALGYLSIYNVVRKFDSSGNDLWTYQFDKQSIILGTAVDGRPLRRILPWAAAIPT